MTPAGRVRVRLLFADGGAYHTQEIGVPAEVLDRYERLIDALREDPAVLRDVHVDVARLCAAWRAEAEDA